MQDYQSPRSGEHRQPGRYLSESERMAQRNKKKKKKQKQRRMLFGGAAAVLIVIVVVIVLIVKGCFGRTDALAGTWDFDGTMTYVFDGNGTGVMALPSISYDFTYTIDGNTLVIDYSNESVHDSTYEFTVDGDILTMVGGCRTDFADIQNKKECGGNRQWQNHYLRNWAANTKGKGII